MKIKFLDKLIYIYIILFFVLQNNFFLTNFLAINEGLGVGRFRSFILIYIIIIGLVLLFFKVITSSDFFLYKVNRFEFITLIIIVSLVILNLIKDYFVYQQVDFIGVAPLVEIIFFGVFFSFFVPDSVTVKKSHILIASFLVFLNISFELFFYFKDTLSGIQYGPFRAHIAGFNINRNPSFFYPMFAFLVLRFAPIGSGFRLIYILIFIVYILTLFYRTIYISLLIPIFLDLIFFGIKIRFFQIFRVFVVLSILIFCLISLDGIFEQQFDFSLINSFSDRFSSTFTDYSEDEAQSGRINQIPDLVSGIILNPFGIGFSGLIKDAEIYAYAFYFLHPILYLGWFVLFYYFIFLKKIRSIFLKAKTSFTNRILFISIVYFIFIIIFFPYMNYFTFLSVLVFLVQMSNVQFHYIKN